MKNKLAEILDKFEVGKFAMQLALRDALVYGRGFISVDKDGHIVYHDSEEAFKLAKEMYEAQCTSEQYRDK